MHRFDTRRALRTIPLALAAAAAIATGGFAVASGLGFLSNAPAGNFTAEDVQIQQDAAGVLIRDGSQGDSREWANPKTTAKGKLTIVKVFKSTEGFPARRCSSRTAPWVGTMSPLIRCAKSPRENGRYTRAPHRPRREIFAAHSPSRRP